MQSKPLIAAAFILVLGVLAIILFSTLSNKEQLKQTTQEIVEPSPDIKMFSLAIENGELVNEENEKLTVNEGEEVLLEVTADADTEFHLHGYDILEKLSTGETEDISFVADVSGRFEFELEETGSTLGALEVLPQ